MELCKYYLKGYTSKHVSTTLRIQGKNLADAVKIEDLTSTALETYKDLHIFKVKGNGFMELTATIENYKITMDLTGELTKIFEKVRKEPKNLPAVVPAQEQDSVITLESMWTQANG